MLTAEWCVMATGVKPSINIGTDNSVKDIAKLVQYAHRFHSRIFVTLNTILRDDELEGARKLAWRR